MQQTASASPAVVRALSMANALLNRPAGLTKEEIFEKVELYREKQTEIHRLSEPQRSKAAEAFEKQFRLDKDALRSCGISLGEPTSENDYRYQISTADYGLPDLRLSAEEQLVLCQAQLLFASSNVSGLQHALWAINPDNDAPSVPLTPKALQAGIGSDTELEQLLALAGIGIRRPVTFDYTGHGRRSSEIRRVVPLGIEARGHWYLIAHDLDRNEQRTFRLDRVHGHIEQLRPKGLTGEDAQTVQQIAAGEIYQEFQAAAVLDGIGDAQQETEQAEGVLRAHSGPAPEPPKLQTPPTPVRKDDAQAKTERVINMVSLLLHSGGIPPSQLLTRYGISAAQLLRDLLSINQVSTIGFPSWSTLEVHPEPPLNDAQFLDDYLTADEPVTLVTSSDDAKALDRPVSLTKPGALSLMIALKSLHRLCLPGEEHTLTAVASLQEKILSILPTSIAEAAQVMTLSHTAADSEHLRITQHAIAAGHALELEYTDSSGNTSERTIDPVQIVYDGPQTYLRAWCRRAAGERLFRLGRINQLRPLHHEPHSAEATALDLSETTRPRVPRTEDSIEVILRFAPFAAAQAGLYSPQKQHTEKSTGARTIRTHFVSREAAVRTCLEAGGDIEVIRPKDLREEVRRRAEQLLGA